MSQSSRSLTKSSPSLSKRVCRLAMFTSGRARSVNEFLLLDWLSLKPVGWPIALSLSRHSSRTDDSERTSDSRDESPELSRSATGRHRVRSGDLLSGPANAFERAAAGLGFAKPQRDPSESGKCRSQRH